jgi:alpha-tubulin suppressor-like RCC1 family protein
VFSFGSNANGRTGRNTTSGFTGIATAINTSNLGGRLITQVAAGNSHSLLLAEDGTVFSFGQNEFGETGLGTDAGNTLIATPIDTSNLGGRTITQVAAGSALSLLLADDGTVFSFGTNANGRTGLNTDTGLTLVATPIDATNLAGMVVTQISAGGAFSLLLAEPGEILSTPALEPATLLGSIRPNPTPGSARIAFTLAESGPVRLRVYDLSGKLVRTLEDAIRPAGAHETTWDGADDTGQPAGAGLFFVKLETAEAVSTRKLVRLR